MNVFLKLILPSLLLLMQFQSPAQFYDIGQEPASTRWNVIKTGNFSIIFPSGYTRATETALQFRLAENAVISGNVARPGHTPIVLHSMNPVSNAYAIWAPRRIEILTTPPQDTYAQPWIQQLALHEYRHIVQLSSLNQGFTRFMGYLFGQQAAAISTGLFIPSWYIEGDAVASETALGYSGRGRVASFSQPLRAQLAEKGAYSYAKASLGSYKDFVPDIYTTGYHLIAATRIKYGPGPWNHAINTVARKPWTITPFNLGLKQTTGLNKKGLYRDAVKSLDSLWNNNERRVVSHIPLSGKRKGYMSYLHPHRINDTVIVALKTSFSDIPRIVSISKTGKERKIHTPGYIIDERISFSGGWLSWAEYRPHVRWETVGYTTIVQLDPNSGRLNRREFRQKLYAPVVNPRDSSIAAIGYRPEGDCYIAIINPSSTTEHTLPDNLHGSTPWWTPDGKSLVFIVTGSKGKALAKINTETGIQEYLSAFSFNEISNLFFSGENLCFTGTTGGRNQIFMAGKLTDPFCAVTNAPYGADYASAWDGELVFSDYTADGYRIASQFPEVNQDLQFQSGPTKEWPLAEAISAQETRVDFSGNTGIEVPEAGRYRKGTHLFSFHSWAPVFVDIGGETVRPGVSVMSQNLLSTLFVSAGYDYNTQEEAGMFRTDLTWKGWFPVLKATISEGLRASSVMNEETGTAERFTWNETNLDLSISQNLNLSRGAYFKGLYGEVGYNYSGIRHNSSTPDDFVKGNLTGMTYRVAGYAYRRQAFRDLGPRDGIYFDAEYRHTPFGQLKAGSILGIQMQLFLPGFMPNHSVLIYGGLQFSDPENYRFSNIISVSRGYSADITGNDLRVIKISYRLPLLYPDVHAGGLLYIKRIRANVFHDISAATDPDPYKLYSSTGLDLVADFHLFGLSTPVSAGIRTIYLENSSEFTTGLLFSVNLYDY
ncbi:MAG: hypothetical protein FD166_2927 [Bacteroidetes bacterium]|nr:MAG: hypothetical protein FD166_2927 [Bacteroidota bacterium]